MHEDGSIQRSRPLVARRVARRAPPPSLHADEAVFYLSIYPALSALVLATSSAAHALAPTPALALPLLRYPLTLPLGSTKLPNPVPTPPGRVVGSGSMEDPKDIEDAMVEAIQAGARLICVHRMTSDLPFYGANTVRVYDCPLLSCDLLRIDDEARAK